MGTAVSDATENLALCSDVTQQLPSGAVVPVEWFLITVRDVLELLSPVYAACRFVLTCNCQISGRVRGSLVFHDRI